MFRRQDRTGFAAALISLTAPAGRRAARRWPEFAAVSKSINVVELIVGFAEEEAYGCLLGDFIANGYSPEHLPNG